VAGEYYITKKIKVEARAMGFAWPHKAVQTDGEVKLTARIYKQLDIVLAYKAFHFKTNPQKDYYLKETMYGPYGGLRWTFK
jgi:hypothetical protein